MIPLTPKILHSVWSLQGTLVHSLQLGLQQRPRFFSVVVVFLDVFLVSLFEADVVTELLAEELDETVSVAATSVARWTKTMTMARWAKARRL